MALHRGYVINSKLDFAKQGGLYQSVPTSGRGINQRLTWGDPAKITQAKLDKQCPNCGARVNDKKLEPFELMFEGLKCVAGYCPNCKWSFELGLTRSGWPQF